MTQMEASFLCDMEQSHLSCIITGKKMPTLETALRISNALDVPTDELFSLDLEPTNELAAKALRQLARLLETKKSHEAAQIVADAAERIEA